MVAVFNKELLSWYLITLKLKETVDAGIPTSSRAIELPGPQNQPPSDALQIEINGPKSPPESEWMITVREKLDLAQKDDVAGTWGKLCIYKVPQYLRDGEDKAYIPNIVSLGPYHHGKRRLRNMDRHKWRAFYQILKRCEQDAKIYINSIKELEERARDCYEGQITISSNEFVEMMVLDGCFVLELFRGAAEGFNKLGYSRCDPVFAMRGSMHSIQRDMVMLENQIPLFILDRLLGLQFGQPDQKGLVAKLALHFFDPLMPTDEPLTKSDRNKMETSLGFTSPSPFDPLSDQSYLHYCGIIEHWLGSDSDVADLFNRLCQEVVFDINNSYLSELSEKVNRFYNHRWNSWRASLMHNYFSNPWAIISFIAAVILLILTSAQTFYGVYGYYRPP